MLLDHVHIWLLFCMNRVLAWHLQMALRICLPTVVSGSIPRPFSNVNDRIMQMSDAVLSEGPKTTSIQQRSSALSLMTEILPSSFSESFDECMNCE